MMTGPVIWMIENLSGMCLFLGAYLIAWNSHKQKVVECSSTESEYRALSLAASDIIWVQSLLAELGIHPQTQPPILWCDNLGAEALALNPVYHSWTKHIDIDVYFI